MDRNLKELITVDGLMEAEIIKSKLENYDIPVLLKYEAVSKIFGITMNGIGKVKVMVPEEFLNRALEILELE